MSTAPVKDQDFVEYIAKAIVDHPDDVKVERTVDEMGVLITLKINQQHMGYVIGRQGQNARALRTLLRIVGARNNARVNLKIYEPEGSQRPPRIPREQRDDRMGGSSPMHDDVDTSALDDLKI